MNASRSRVSPLKRRRTRTPTPKKVTVAKNNATTPIVPDSEKSEKKTVVENKAQDANASEINKKEDGESPQEKPAEPKPDTTEGESKGGVEKVENKSEESTNEEQKEESKDEAEQKSTEDAGGKTEGSEKKGFTDKQKEGIEGTKSKQQSLTNFFFHKLQCSVGSCYES